MPSILTYNLFAQAAQPELEGLQATHQFDMMCLQECHPEYMPSQIGGLHLAANTSAGRYGLAIYYNDARYDLLHAEAVPISLPHLERLNESLRKSSRQRLLIAQFRERSSGQGITVGSFHATQLPSANSIRRRQITEALQALDHFRSRGATVLIGDYNYPIFLGGLRQFVRKQGYELAVPNQPTYPAKIFRGYHLDLAAVRGAKQSTAEALPQGASDHLPVKVMLEFSK